MGSCSVKPGDHARGGKGLKGRGKKKKKQAHVASCVALCLNANVGPSLSARMRGTPWESRA